MKRFLYILLFTGLASLLLYGVWMVWAAAVFSGAFDTKYSREELVENFNRNEQAFAGLHRDFSKALEVGGQYTVIVNHEGQGLRIVFRPLVTTPSSYNTEFRFKKGATEIKDTDTLLRALGWNAAVLSSMTDNMEKINCQWIMTGPHDRVRISPRQEGWGSFTYTVLPENERPDSNALSTQGFGRRTILTYSSAL